MNSDLKVLDLFSGMGGFSYGFKRAGFEVTGIDSNGRAVKTYENVTGGRGMIHDLYNFKVKNDYTGIIGGPPCRPWSTVNLHRRGVEHRDYGLVNIFFNTVLRVKPQFFIMENVPAIRQDPAIKDSITKMEHAGYKISKAMYTYSDFGAPVARKRFFVSGVAGSRNTIFEEVDKKKVLAKTTVKDAIWDLRDSPENAVIGHEWPKLKTIEKYRKYYQTGKFGWRQLNWESPAPSFGNVMKTYTLHPDFGIDSKTPRVISILEASRIMGFESYPFSDGIGKGERYQMIVDSVSPVFSRVIGEIVYEIVSREIGVSENQ